MKKIIIIVLVFVCTAAYARTTVNLTPADANFSDIPVLEDSLGKQVQDVTDKNGKFIANSFALANMLGYPIGKSSIGHFPHMEAGIALGVALTNAKYFDDKAEDGTFPGVMANPVVHAGFGLAGNFDIIGKLFYFRKNIYDPDIDTDTARLQDFNFISFGAKLRYNYLKEATILPFLLSFGGLTFSIGGDIMMGNVDVTGEYDAEYEDITVTYSSIDYPLSANLNSTYGATVSWTVFTLSAQAIAYIDVMYLFSFYTGFGLATNLGFFSTDFNGNGQLTSDDPTFLGVKADGLIGTMEFESVNSYMPGYLIPTFIFGVEINLFVIKLTADTMVNLANRSDVTLQGGVRMQL
ncbi:MAG TPA: hypothetical protein PK348_10095 [Spirochaetota bacterium]|nr:hypothetical protein [Spirochaetota bacterium]